MLYHDFKKVARARPSKIYQPLRADFEFVPCLECSSGLDGTLDGGMHATGIRKYLYSGIQWLSSILDAAKPHIVVAIRGSIPVAIGAPQVV